MSKTMTIDEARGFLSQADQAATGGDLFEALRLVGKVLRVVDRMESPELNREALEHGSRYMKELSNDGWVIIDVDPKERATTWVKGPVAFA